MERGDPKELLAALARQERSRATEGAERRQFSRFTVRGEATLMADARWASGASQDEMVANIRDASRGGLGLVTRHRMVVGRSYRLVCVSDGIELFSAEVMPRHVAVLPEGLTSAGVVFLAEGAWLVSLGVAAAAIRASEGGDDLASPGGDFTEVAA